MLRRSWSFAFAFLACTRARSPESSALTDATTRSSDGEVVAFRSGGQGDVALVFVHGWCIEQTYWDSAMAAFRPRARVVSLDLVGHGRSGRGRKTWTLEAYAGDVEAVIDALALKRVALVGHSMSGPISIEVARRRPGQVVALVGVDALQAVGPVMPPETRHEKMEWLRRDFGTNGAKFAEELFLPGAPRPPVERVLRSVAACPTETAVATLDNLFQYPTAERLTGVRAPIVSINAGLEPADPESVRKYAPRFEVVEMPGVGHYPMIEDPPRFESNLARALERAGVLGPATKE